VRLQQRGYFSCEFRCSLVLDVRAFTVNSAHSEKALSKVFYYVLDDIVVHYVHFVSILVIILQLEDG